MCEGAPCGKRFQDPDLKDGLVETSGCVSLRSSHLQVISLSALQQRTLRSLDIKNAFLQADGFERDAFLHAPTEWGPPCTNKAWKPKAPTYGLNDAAVACDRSLKRYSLNADLSVKNVRLRCQASTFGPCLFFVFRDPGQAVGVFTKHIDDILGCGEPDALPRIRDFSEQHSGTMKLQENSFAHVGVELRGRVGNDSKGS